VLLALAKAYVASAYADRLVISSPFTWLSLENAVLLKKVIDAYRSQEKPVQILAMNGEDYDTPLDTISWERPASVPFTVQLLGVSLGLGDTVSASGTSKWQARFRDTSLVLKSPCLVVGNNGSGKSLLACTLSRAIPHEGSATVKCRGRLGGARLLFQDVINQTLMRSFVRIARDKSPPDDASTTHIYQKLIREFIEYFSRSGRDVPLIGHSEATASKSLIEMKTVLIASRLSGEPCALILDEPEWGLSREAAEGLVIATITVAHESGIPILIISHKKWWANIAASTVFVSKESLPSNTLEVVLSLPDLVGGRT
jgi:energy-coupling factor transporter ATP-binding protein EcfA2